MKLYIRNMACESCRFVVADALDKAGIDHICVELGEAEVKGKPSEKKIQKFASTIQKAGLELVDNKESVLVDKIKATIRDYITNKKNIKTNLSEYLSKTLHYDYTYLSTYFSSLTASTIEQFSIALKIERAKEMLLLEGLSLQEIAENLNYSSVSHLSYQFKKVTGLPASHFKKLKEKRRISIQALTEQKQAS